MGKINKINEKMNELKKITRLMTDKRVIYRQQRIIHKQKDN